MAGLLFFLLVPVVSTLVLLAILKWKQADEFEDPPPPELPDRPRPVLPSSPRRRATLRRPVPPTRRPTPSHRVFA